MISSIAALQQQQQQAYKPPYTERRPSNETVETDAASIQAKSAEIEDSVNISGAAKTLNSEEQKAGGADEENLSEDQRRQVDELKKRDQEVKAHERAHMAAGGGLVRGGASYTYQRGPDGQLYAVGGEVSIDTSSERDPDQTVRKMEQVKRAALAPAEPSGTDRAVAAQASQVQLQARMEKTKGENTESEDGAQTISGEPSDENAVQPPATGPTSDDETVQAAAAPNSQDDTFQAVSDGSLFEESDPGNSNQTAAKNPVGFNPYNQFQNDTNPVGHQINISA